MVSTPSKNPLHQRSHNRSHFLGVGTLAPFGRALAPPKIARLWLLWWSNLSSGAGPVLEKCLAKWLQEHFNTWEGKRSRWSHVFLLHLYSGSCFGASCGLLGWSCFTFTRLVGLHRSRRRSRWRRPTKRTSIKQALSIFLVQACSSIMYRTFLQNLVWYICVVCLCAQ